MKRHKYWKGKKTKTSLINILSVCVEKTKQNKIFEKREELTKYSKAAGYKVNPS